MIRHIEHSGIDKIKWDHCIAGSAFSPAYAFSWYLDIACNQRWDALIYDDYEAVMPLPYRKKGGIHYIYPPYFVQQLGIFARHPADESLTKVFLKAIPARFSYCEINLNCTNDAGPIRPGLIRNINTELQLNRPISVLSSAYSDNLKRNLRKAQEAGIVATDVIEADQLIAIFKENKGAEIGKFGEQEYDILRSLMQESVRRDAGFLCGVKNREGQLIAGAFFVRTTGRLIFLFSSAVPEARDCAAIPYIMDQQIQRHAGKQLIFDLEGSNNKNLLRFYKSFGAEETYYHRIIINRLPIIAKYLLKWRHLMKKN